MGQYGASMGHYSASDKPQHGPRQAPDRCVHSMQSALCNAGELPFQAGRHRHRHRTPQVLSCPFPTASLLHLQSYLGPLDHLIGAVVHLVTVDYYILPLYPADSLPVRVPQHSKRTQRPHASFI
jgi:hypothetical protein